MKAKIKKIRKSQGFTLIELLVVVIIIGILAAIALPNFIGVQDKARNASVKANMRTTQIAAESYATDNGGTYPASIDVPLESYFPGGKSDGASAGNPPVNPFTNAGAWSDFVTTSISDVPAERQKTPSSSSMANQDPGKIGYNGFGDSPTGTNKTSYAIEGSASGKVALAGSAPGTTLVLSNQ